MMDAEIHSSRDPYRQLAAAIVDQAVRDYLSILVRLCMKTEGTSSRSLVLGKLDYEEFFHSGWFQTLSDLDGDSLIHLIQQKAEENAKRRIREQEKRNIRHGFIGDQQNGRGDQ